MPQAVASNRLAVALVLASQVLVATLLPPARPVDAAEPEGSVAPSSPGAVAEATADPRQAEREAELARIRGEIEELRGRLTTVRSRESTVENEVGGISIELELQEARLSEASAAAELAAARAGAAQAKVGELEIALSGVREDLRRRLGGLYRLGREGYLRLFLAVEPTSRGGETADFLPAIRQLRFLARRDQEALERYRATRDELAAQRIRLEEERLEVEAWKQREQERRDELAELRRRQQRLLNRLASERQKLARRADALEDKERKLARLIGTLVGKEPVDGAPIQDFRGALDWPANGRVVSGFGARRDPRYRTEVPHNGLDIELENDAEIRSVFLGEVLFASHFAGYGQMVVVHHPGRVFTLYAGLEELRVAKGDVVSLGSVLGRAAELLYFEIRHENQPVDPSAWLR